MPDYVLDYTLQGGEYDGYRVVFEKDKFLEHQLKYPTKWWYQNGGYKNFVDNLIPKAFEEGSCFCPSNHKKKNKFCLYSIYTFKWDINNYYIEYLKIPFTVYKKEKLIKIHTYNKVSNISEQICKMKMKSLISSRSSS